MCHTRQSLLAEPHEALLFFFFCFVCVCVFSGVLDYSAIYRGLND